MAKNKLSISPPKSISSPGFPIASKTTTSAFSTIRNFSTCLLHRLSNLNLPFHWYSLDTPQWQGTFNFQALLISGFQVISVTERLCWRLGQLEWKGQGASPSLALPQVVSPAVTTSPPQPRLSQVSPSLHADSSHQATLVSGLRSHYLSPLSIQL